MKRNPDRSLLDLTRAQLAATLDRLGEYVRGYGDEQASRAHLVENGRTIDGYEPALSCVTCSMCGVVLGNWTRVHFAKAGDARPCQGSWR